MSAKLTLALVGCGAISQLHLPAVRKGAPRTEITAVVDTDAARAQAMAERTGARPLTSLDAALAAGGFDAVDLMLPHHLHEEIAVRCFAAGKHVLLEKPMANDADACARIECDLGVRQSVQIALTLLRGDPFQGVREALVPHDRPCVILA